MFYAFYTIVIAVDKPYSKVCPTEAAWLYAIAMILACDICTTCPNFNAWLIVTAVAKFEFVGFSADGSA